MNRRQLLKAVGVGLAGAWLPAYATLPERQKIVVLGIGGAGFNLASALWSSNVLNQPGIEVEYVAADSDTRTITRVGTTNLGSSALSPIKAVQLELPKSEADEESGWQSLYQPSRRLHRQIANADMVVLLAGMGGETGSRFTSALARLARQNGALTFAVVVTPFEFEGMRNDRAAFAVGLLIHEADQVMAISNTEWAKRYSDDTPLIDILAALDRHVAEVVYAFTKRGCKYDHIAETTPGRTYTLR